MVLIRRQRQRWPRLAWWHFALVAGALLLFLVAQNNDNDSTTRMTQLLHLQSSSSSSSSDQRPKEATMQRLPRRDPDGGWKRPSFKTTTTTTTKTGAGTRDNHRTHDISSLEALPKSFLQKFDTANNRNKAPPHPKKYLVLCQPYHPSLSLMHPLLPLFQNYTLIRLDQNQTPPPWDSEAVLVLNKNDKRDNVVRRCQQEHPYVIQAQERRRRATYVPVPHELQGQWVAGVYWPRAVDNENEDATATTNATHHQKNSPLLFLKHLRHRPAILRVLGEVFWRELYQDASCADVDFQLYRETEHPAVRDCLTLHFVQGASSSYARHPQFDYPHARNILQGHAPHPNRPQTWDKFQHKIGSSSSFYHKGTCSYLVKQDPDQPVTTLQSTHKDVDALVRDSFFRLVNRHIPGGCQRITHCQKNPSPYAAHECLKGYKFHITMDNTRLRGYISEKLWNGQLAGGIPIYFGAPNVGDFVNPHSLVHCQISDAMMQQLRAVYPRRRHGGGQRQWVWPPGSSLSDNNNSTVATFTTSTTIPTNEQLIQYVDGLLHPEALQPCLEQMRYLHQNDTAYWEMIHQQPFLTNHDILSGQYPYRGLELALRVMAISKDVTRQSSRS